MFVAITLAVASADSAVQLAIFGVRTKLSSFKSLSLGSADSNQKTSNAAPAVFVLEI